ncbi:3-deoxy-7-phosphoheptulonate synthase [Candidatus Vidania fulgoroideorum]
MNKKNVKTLKKIINGNKNKLIVIIGPCSINGIKYSLKFSNFIKKNKRKFNNLFILMRVYLEKPRTNFGWKGYIYDPDLNFSYKIKKGIKNSLLLLKLISKDVPIATEFLNNILAYKLYKYITLGTIGARTTESQIHRELSSDLDIPIGFKNNLNGDVLPAVNSIISSKFPTICILEKKFKISKGNKNCFLILRGGEKGPNYNIKNIKKYICILKKNSINSGIIIDFSHGNSGKKAKNQKLVCDYFCKNLINFKKLVGVMIESNIKSGSQDIKKKIDKRISITDECLSWKEGLKIMTLLNKNMNKRKSYY